LLQHGVVIARTDPQIAGDDLPLAFLGQNAGEKAPALVALKTLFPQGQRLGQGRGAEFLEPAFGIIEDHLAAVILYKVTDQFVMQIDIERSSHGLLSFRGSRGWRQRQFDSQCLQDR
jgi:hypothetical protein